MQTLILLRHGESEGNAGNVFTGWLDVPLTEHGRQQALDSGRLLRETGLRPTAAHSSALQRARHTCTLALAAAGCREIPVSHTWRLNERHYGVLQGRERRAAREEYGAERIRRWRRSPGAAPPPLPADENARYAGSAQYGGRSADDLPGSESLNDVTRRLLPYWHERVARDLRAGHTVLVVAHSNSLRALIAHLEGLSVRETERLAVPTGIPLRYDLDECLVPAPRSGHRLGPEGARGAAKSRADRGGLRSAQTR